MALRLPAGAAAVPLPLPALAIVRPVLDALTAHLELKKTCTWDFEAACVRLHEHEVPVPPLPRLGLCRAHS